MFEIFYKLREIQKDLSGSEDFKSGFETCMELLRIGISKAPKYNLHIKIKELENENTKLKKKIGSLEEELDNSAHQINELSNKYEMKSKVMQQNIYDPEFNYMMIASEWGVMAMKTNASKEIVEQALEDIKPVLLSKYRDIQISTVYSRLNGRIQQMGYYTKSIK